MTSFAWAPAFGNDLYYAEEGIRFEHGTWTFSSLPSGYYRVSGTWSPWPNRATDAPYTVYDNTTSVGTVTDHEFVT